MILIGKVKTGLGNANYWIKKIEEIFEKKTGIKLFYGTLNIELEKPYIIKKDIVLLGKEYGGTQEVYIQNCKVLENKSFIIRSSNTDHPETVIEIVSDVNFRKKYNLKDGDLVKVFI